MDVLDSVRRYIDRQRLLHPEQPVVVGVSGGADSLCTLDCLRRLGYRCLVAHLDHGLRQSSAAEAERVGELAAEFGLEFVSHRVELSQAPGSLEEAARLARYRFLASAAHSHEIDTIAVGHTADDQAETVLMHLLRGAGPSGLRGMLPLTRLGEWVGVDSGSGLRLIRPLLEQDRSTTEQYCAQHGLEVIADESNLDPSLFRNRLRHELLPELRSYNPEIKQVLSRTAKVMAGEAALIDELVGRRWSEWARRAGKQALALRRGPLEAAPVALRRAALRRAIGELRPDLRDIAFETVEQLVSDLEQGNGVRRTIVGGLEVLPLGSELVIRAPSARISFPTLPQLADRQPRRLAVPGALTLAEGWELVAQSVKQASEPPSSRLEAMLDQDKLGTDLQVRPPATGDRLRPLGMRGTVKLSDLFVNRKIPWPARERWPVVCQAGEVLWVVGLHLSRHAAASPATQSVLRLRALPPGRLDAAMPVD